MKRIPILLMFILLFGFARISAQENTVSADKWMRVETDDKEFSVAMPANAVIDAEERKFGQKLRAVAFQNGVEMELKIAVLKNVTDRLGNLQLPGVTKLTGLKFGDFSIVKKEQRSPTKSFFITLWINKKDTLYFLNVSAKTGQEKEVTRFLTSINLQGNPLVVQKEKQNFPEEWVSVSALKTSAEVAEAFERKLQKNKINVTYEAASDDADDIETEGLTRKAIILERPIPTLNSGIGGIGGNGIFAVKLKVNFLANGQIGDITVLSVVNKEFSKACVEAAQKIRFVPAQVNGKNVDSTRVVEYNVQIFSVPGTVRR